MAIDIGAAATNRTSQAGGNGGYTEVRLDNPANASGVITSMEIWVYQDCTGVKVGTFSRSGDIFTCRSSALIGNVATGAKRTYSGLAIQVVVGDYIGFYLATGNIEADTTGGSGLYYKLGDHFSDGAQTYTLAANQIFSLYGIGIETWQNINKMNGIINYGIAKVNGLAVLSIAKVNGLSV